MKCNTVLIVTVLIVTVLIVTVLIITVLIVTVISGPSDVICKHVSMKLLSYISELPARPRPHRMARPTASVLCTLPE